LIPRSTNPYKTPTGAWKEEQVGGIGIVGSGIAGLHLGLYLLQHDVPTTIYTETTAEQIASGRLPNTVGHHHCTLDRERLLGVHFWDAAEYGYDCHHHYVGGEQPLFFPGFFTSRSSSIDYRLYLPRLMAEYEDRGGTLVVATLQPEDVERLSEQHDLMVVCSGRGALASLFPRRPEKSPYDRPQRRLCAGLYHGITRTDPIGVSLSISPGNGELLELPMFSMEGHITVLLFECIPGGEMEVLADLPYEADPKLFLRTVLELVERLHPKTFERIDPRAFALTGPLDLLQGALTPTVRSDYVQLDTGTYALAVGDAHTVVDPVMGQGANSASYSAWTVGEAIVDDYVYDERFCRRVARAREERVLGISDWVNFMLAPPAPHLLELIGAMSQDQAICDEFTENFNAPERTWDFLATSERTQAFLERRGVRAPVG
jgi:2-polyprenyl-6-methoxyphenol hydroxylase-like FAD-dependent oxidoreductase